MDSIWAVIIGWIPQLTVVSYTGLALYGLRMTLSRAVAVSSSISFASYVFKYLISLLNLPYGLHMPVSVVLLIIVLHSFVQVKWSTAVIAAISSYILISIVDVLSIIVMFDVLNLKLTVKEILSNWWIQVSIIHLETIPIYILAVILHFKKFTIFNLSSKNPGVRL